MFSKAALSSPSCITWIYSMWFNGLKADFGLAMIAEHVCNNAGRKSSHGALHWKRLKLLAVMYGMILVRREGEKGECFLEKSSRLPLSPSLLNANLKPQGESKVWKCTPGWQHVDGLVQSLAKQGLRINEPLSKIQNHFTLLRKKWL